MPVKRRNRGRNKGRSRGHTNTVRCDSCTRVVQKDKAIKRFIVRNMVETSSLKDIIDQSVVTDYVIPKMYAKMQYCVSCACHSRTVRVRSRDGRRNREPPRRYRPRS
mmetsp:Transcript_2302/g.2580  ORF Transcript_2302/g.2580 Transcript_2302/m.2580 type:complete len:107 (+) Transcript_2302:75-395(+)